MTRTLHRKKVPYPGHVLKHGAHGPNVRILQRGLLKAGVRHKKVTARFGDTTRKNVQHFQAKHHLLVDGQVGQHTWEALQPYFDGLDLWIHDQWEKHKPRPTASLAPREKVVKFAFYYLHNAGIVHYLQQRPYQEIVCPPELNNYLDCSEFVINAYKCAGLPDPSGYNYDGYGNTYTMLDNPRGRRVRTTRPGDLVFYSNPSHVITATDSVNGISNGSEGGPYFVSQNYRVPVAKIDFIGG